jgi:hypothetical protein
MQGRVNTEDLVRQFRESRHQTLVDSKEVKPKNQKFHSTSQKKSVTSDKYQSFLNKYSRLEETVDEFNTQDLMYFFREKSNESGHKYVIANMKRDMGIFKRLRDNYESRDICLMIEFLFSEEQDYIDQSDVQPTLLASSWCNKLYSDSILWANDEYVSKKVQKHKNREWTGSKEDNNSRLGGWD